MLDGNDTGTFYALRLLRDIVDKREKPVIIWAGAGVSKWCGFPTWLETAERIDKTFRRSEAKYDKALGRRLIQERKFPELFETLQRANRPTYNQELASLFVSRAPTPVYARFLSIVRQITPLRIVTTNVDETLERNLPDLALIQKSDLERCLDLIRGNDSFVAKLHGSISSIDSLVFTSSEYQSAIDDASYMATISRLFAQATVIFVGYSMRDQHILDLFVANAKARPLFGDGPHFLVKSDGDSPAPETVKVIRYLPQPHTDHRSAITVLDIVRVVQAGPEHVWFRPEDNAPRPDNDLASAYFISDITPPGTWTSSQSLMLARKDGISPNAIVGQGFDDSELPVKISPAMHDLMVGLVGFDRLYIPLSCSAKVHDLLGSETFWEMVKDGLFHFINFENEPVVMFRSLEAVDGGDIATIRPSGDHGGPLTIEEQIRKQFKAVPGREAEAQQLFETLRPAVFPFDHARFNIPSLTRGALLHPSVQRLLGISDAVSPTGFPRWSAFPVLRLAHTIMAGCACDNFSLPAIKLGFGSEILIGAAFAMTAARDWAENVSSYVLTGRFNTDLGAYVQDNPDIIKAILKFRDTQEGFNLRRDIVEQLSTNAGGEFVASVNAGIKRLLPNDILDKAHDQLSGLLLRAPNTRVVPAVWTNVLNSDESTRLWRARSRRELEAYCRSRGIRDAGLCPCGSGEKLKDCCSLALRR